MHETSLVAELVGECERRAQGRKVERVRVRHAATFHEEGLHEMFAALAFGGPLESAELDVEEFVVEFSCDDCEFSGAIDDAYVYGHVRVCPGCGAVSEDAESAELELVDLVLSRQPMPAASAVPADPGGSPSRGSRPASAAPTPASTAVTTRSS